MGVVANVKVEPPSWPLHLPEGAARLAKALQKEQQLNRNWGAGSGKLGASGAGPRGPVFTKPRSTCPQTVLDTEQIAWSSWHHPQSWNVGEKARITSPGLRAPSFPDKQPSYGHWEEVGDIEQVEWVRYSCIHLFIHSFTLNFSIFKMGKGIPLLSTWNACSGEGWRKGCYSDPMRE